MNDDDMNDDMIMNDDMNDDMNDVMNDDDHDLPEGNRPAFTSSTVKSSKGRGLAVL